MQIEHELFRPFADIWEVGDRSFEWLAHDDDLLLRPCGAPLSTVWVMLNQAQIGPLLAMPRSRNEPRLPPSVKTRHSLQGRLLWRLWPISPTETCLVRSRGSLLRAPDLQAARFAHPNLADFDVASDRQMSNWSQSLQAPNSDFNCARRWQKLSQSEKIERNYYGARRHLGRIDANCSGRLLFYGRNRLILRCIRHRVMSLS